MVTVISCSTEDENNDQSQDCTLPSDVSIISITENTASISWTSNSENVSFQIEYGETNFELGNGNVLSSNNNSITITGLNSGINYSLYVRTVCNNDFSNWVGPVNFSTPEETCVAPTDLQVFNIDSNYAEFYWNTQNNIISSTIEYGEAGFTLGQGISNTTSNNFYFAENLLPSTEYEFYVKTNCSSDNSSEYIGPIAFTTEDACTTPQNLDFTNIESCAFNIYWSGLGETSWEVEYGEIGFTIGSGTSLITSNTSLYIDGLTPSTTYEIYVRANCGSDGFSDYSEALVVTTNPIMSGDWVINMFDSYGDGWQTTTSNGGDGITINFDGTIVEVGLCSPYGGAAGTFLGSNDCVSGLSSGSATVNIPTGTQSLTWYFPGDFFSEISFDIYNPDGQLVGSVSSGTAAGFVDVDLCD